MTEFSYEAAFCRNIGVFSEAEQLILRSKHVAIPGCGGVGSLHALVLARMGIGRFSIADFDSFEIENFNRQFGARVSTIGRDKVEVIRQEILEINPSASVRVFRQGLTESNAEEFLKGVDLVVDSLDFFAFEARDILFPKAQQRGVPLVTAAPLGMSAALLIFTKASMSYGDYFGFVPGEAKQIRALKFALGLAPKATHRTYVNAASIDFARERGPSVSIGVSLCAAMAGGEAVKILLNRGAVRTVPRYTQFDTYRGLFKQGTLLFGSRNPVLILKRWFLKRYYLKALKDAA